MKLVLAKIRLGGRWVGRGNTDSLHVLLGGLCPTLGAGFHRALRPTLWSCCSGLMFWGVHRAAPAPACRRPAQLLGPSFRDGAWVGSFVQRKQLPGRKCMVLPWMVRAWGPRSPPEADGLLHLWWGARVCQSLAPCSTGTPRIVPTSETPLVPSCANCQEPDSSCPRGMGLLSPAYQQATAGASVSQGATEKTLSSGMFKNRLKGRLRACEVGG